MVNKRPMVIGRGSTEPVDPVSGLTPTEAVWARQVVRHMDELNRLLDERGSPIRYTLDRRIT